MSQATTEALSAALFHFLWQGAILALIPTLALMFRSPRIRYGAACLALFAMPVVFLSTFEIFVPQPGAHALFSPGIHLAAGPGPDASALRRPFDFAQSMRWFVPFWITGVCLFYLRTLGSWIAVQRMRRNSSFPAPAVWRQRVEELAKRLGIRKAVALLSSELVDVPVVAGFLRPAIFVPASLFTGMPSEQLEYLLIHELAHIRRFDYAVNLVQKAVEGLLFYHPAVWWVSHILRTERENCCDDAVVAMQGNAREYASVLASLEQSRMDPALPTASMAATGGQLSKRIFRLMNKPQHLNASPALAMIAIAMTATFAWSALQQSTPPASDAYRKWVNEDVAYIIQDAERAAFQRLSTDEERDRFIDQFWEKRNPVPGSPHNDFKEEHYRRIAMANTRFTAGTRAGWKTDRGRIYITYGPPDEIDSHPGDFYETWKYKLIQGVGNDILLEFRDTDHDGTYPMTKDPNR